MTIVDINLSKIGVPKNKKFATFVVKNDSVYDSLNNVYIAFSVVKRMPY